MFLDWKVSVCLVVWIVLKVCVIFFMLVGERMVLGISR